MTARSPSVLRSALSLMSIRLVLEQIGLALFVFLLYVVWLRMPDASVLDVIGSASLALVVLAVAGAGESALILRLADRPRTPSRLLLGTLLLLAGVALWFAWSALLDRLDANDFLYAGYWNSRFPHSLRNFFSFEHILLWLQWLWAILQWIGAGIIALFVFTATASTRPLRAAQRGLRSVSYWVTVVFGIACATVLTASLIDWTPGHGLRIEMVGLIARLTVAVLIVAAIACLLLAIVAACVRQTDALYSTPAGTPAESHPRTVENP
ncbi:MAG: hypothetical protein ABSG84_10920 [Acidobacteriaceae bacterium]|jgi:MFS family permease